MATIYDHKDNDDDDVATDDHNKEPWCLPHDPTHDGKGVTLDPPSASDAPNPTSVPGWRHATTAAQATTTISDHLHDQPRTADEWDEPDVLANSAASIVMKHTYAARMARFDLLRPTQGLARYLTKWTKRKDKQLHRLMSYINHTKTWRSVGWLGDPIDQLQPVLFTDADHAGCADSKISTSGVFCCMKGPITNFPISAISKRQTAVSTSTTEAELAAAQTGISKLGLPVLSV